MGTNIRGWHKHSHPSDTQLIMKNGVIDKDSAFSTSLKIVVRALHGPIFSFPCVSGRD